MRTALLLWCWSTNVSISWSIQANRWPLFIYYRSYSGLKKNVIGADKRLPWLQFQRTLRWRWRRTWHVLLRSLDSSSPVDSLYTWLDGSFGLAGLNYWLRTSIWRNSLYSLSYGHTTAARSWPKTRKSPQKGLEVPVLEVAVPALIAARALYIRFEGERGKTKQPHKCLEA